MKLRSLASRFTPDFIKSLIRSQKNKNEQKKFDSIEPLSCETDHLKEISEVSLPEIFHSELANSDWTLSKNEIEDFVIPDGTGGVNPGDRRALYYLIHYFKPESVLEIGTHIGASTLYIASALFHSRIKKGLNAGLTTLDIRDVNSEFEKPWLQYGARLSPSEMLKELRYHNFVTFVTDRSLHYLSQTDDKFDFIFLDGSHAASNVYREIPAALEILKKDGIILLHDYFPDKKPLWSDNHVITGPYRAVERFKREGVNFKVLPLAGLPWETKKQSNITSLALLLSNQQFK